MSEPFIAEVRMMACDFAPRGWALCNGQTLPIAQNTALFALVGTTFGGDGRTTLGLPDLQDRSPMHVGSGTGLPNRRLGEKVGNPANNVPSSTTEVVFAANLARDLAATEQSQNIAVVAASQSSNYRPSLAVNFVIALQGVFPARS